MSGGPVGVWWRCPRVAYGPALSVRVMDDDLRAQVQAVLAPKFGTGVAVADVRRLSSGASRQTWRFAAASPGQPPRTYVLQREMVAGGPRPGGTPEPLGVTAQARLLTAARQRGVPVPM